MDKAVPAETSSPRYLVLVSLTLCSSMGLRYMGNFIHGLTSLQHFADLALCHLDYPLTALQPPASLQRQKNLVHFFCRLILDPAPRTWSDISIYGYIRGGGGEPAKVGQFLLSSVPHARRAERGLLRTAIR